MHYSNDVVDTVDTIDTLYRYYIATVDTDDTLYRCFNTVSTDNTVYTVYTLARHTRFMDGPGFTLCSLHTATLSVHSIQLLYTVTNYSKNTQ